MISDQVILNCIEEIRSISGEELAVVNAGGTVAKTVSATVPEKEASEFFKGNDNEMESDGRLFLRIRDDDETAFVLVSYADGNGDLCARLAAAQLKNLIIAYKDRIDRNSFFQDLLLDNLLLVDIYNRARKLHIDPALNRCVYVIEPVGTKDGSLMEMVRELFYTEAGDHVTAVDENHIIVIKAVDPGEGEEELKETADMLIEMARSEAMSDVRVAYGTVADDIRGLPASYKEARMALEVSRIFYPLKRNIEYGNLGVGRLIYQLPVSLCTLFIKEIFGDDIPEEIDDEILVTVDRFFDNSLNVSETSRQLFIHRNTLIYRLDKLQKLTGLDVRVFDDALTLKIALMVVNYLRSVETSGKEDRDHSIPRIST